MKLETKLISELTGKFYIPAYQRGYRWGKEEIESLLDDIKKFRQIAGDNRRMVYCLQPLVVRKKEDDKFDLIDGQQRLTTIYLILRFIHENVYFFQEAPFSIEYETRPNSALFMQDLSSGRCNEYIDFCYIRKAYKIIGDWIQRDTSGVIIGDIYNCLFTQVKFIWYDVSDDDEQDDIKLFTRLNIGKIPLTNAELVKALFLCRSQNADTSEDRRREIALMWDNIEKKLHNEAFWYFLTGGNAEDYKTRIDLILNLIADKPLSSRVSYSTFFYFSDRKASGDSVEKIWKDIEHAFLILKEWFIDHELYHKIGYLIAVANKLDTLKNIFDESKNKTKDVFKLRLDEKIKDSIRVSGRNYAELSYEKDGDKEKIKRLLILFNVESVRQHGKDTQWFPFSKFRLGERKKDYWSIEHIHAQDSKMINSEDWRTWIDLHIPFVENLCGKGNGNKIELESLLGRMKEIIGKKDALTKEVFDGIYNNVIKQLPYCPQEDGLHSISNLALLKVGNNAALSNAVFAVKRDRIIEMDMRGEYIPYCTKMVFLKYYSSSDNSQILFWSRKDAVSYVSKINQVLQKYLEKPIELDEQRRKA